MSYLTNKKTRGIFRAEGQPYQEPSMQIVSIDPSLQIFAEIRSGDKQFGIYHDGNYFELRQNNERVGVIDAAHIGGRVIYINGLDIQPKYRGIGLGKKFFSIAENYWKHIGAVEILILPVEGSVGFWEKLGFTSTKDGWSKKL